MRRIGVIGIMAAAVSMAGCTTYDRDRDYYGDGRASTGERVATGAAVGAAVGAGVGAVVGGVSPVEGAIAGAVVGGVAGAASGGDRNWHRDGRGYCYYVDNRGDRIYDYDRRC